MTDQPKDAAQRAAERIDQYLKWCELDYGDPTPCPEPHLEEQYQGLCSNDDIALIAAVIREEFAADKEKVCVWEMLSDRNWKTGCGVTFMVRTFTLVTEEGPCMPSLGFCCNCGHRIEVHND